MTMRRRKQKPMRKQKRDNRSKPLTTGQLWCSPATKLTIRGKSAWRATKRPEIRRTIMRGGYWWREKDYWWKRIESCQDVDKLRKDSTFRISSNAAILLRGQDRNMSNSCDAFVFLGSESRGNNPRSLGRKMRQLRVFQANFRWYWKTGCLLAIGEWRDDVK